MDKGAKGKYIFDYLVRVDGWVDIDEMLDDVSNRMPDWQLGEILLKQHINKAINGYYGELPEHVSGRLSLSMPVSADVSSGYAAIDESRFTDKVEKKLRSEGHKILFNRANRGAGKAQFIDILSLRDKILFYTEVKGGTDNHKLQTGIGPLIYHRFAIEENIMKSGTYLSGYSIVYQLVFPGKFEKDEHFAHRVRQYMEQNERIKIIFIS